VTLIEDFLYPPEDIQDLEAPGAAQKIQHTFDLIFAQLRKLAAASGSGGGGTAHNMLSATHTDSTPAAEADGAIITGQAGKWARLAIGANGRALIAVAGQPEWSTDGHALLIDGGNIDQGTIPQARYPHNLLSAAHPDTSAASPSAGDVITGGDATTSDLSKFYIAGRRFRGIATPRDAGSRKYWHGGRALSALVAVTGAASWQRKALGSAGSVLTSNGVGAEWVSGGSITGNIGASVYRNGNLLQSDRTPQAIVLEVQHFDDGGFWTAAAPTRLTVPSSQSGYYIINGAAAFDSNFGTGHGQVFFKINGVERARVASAATNTAPPYLGNTNLTFIAKLNAGDYVELWTDMLWAAGPHTIVGGSANLYLQIARI
jgi:hypothetical protein